MVRKAIMNFTIDNKRAFNIYSDINLLKCDVNKIDLLKYIDILKKDNSFIADEEGNINFVYPVSALETNHVVTLQDGRSFFAMCAIDALGAAFTFRQDTVINSTCSNTGKDIKVKIKSGELFEYNSKTLHALHVDLNKFTDWAASC